MNAAIYARVSSKRQAKDQTIEQQVERLRAYAREQGWTLEDSHIYRDDGYSGASLSRPGLDALRDHAAEALIEVVLITAPDRLARKYLHQVLLLEELAGCGCRVVFTDRPMSDDPNDQLLLQIRGAVAEYERTLITERMRRGKLAKLRAGTLLPWTRGHYGYRVDPDHPRRPSGVTRDPYEAAVVQQIFAWYGEDGATLYSVAKKLEAAGVRTPRGRPYWIGCSVRAILQDPAYLGTAYGNRYRMVPARGRVSALRPLGAGHSYVARPREEWIAIPVPPIVAEEEFAMAQQKLAGNRQRARRNTRAEYLLQGQVSCGLCRLTAGARTTPGGYSYYVCRGRWDKRRRSAGRPCTSRYIPAPQLDAVVWEDLCQVLRDPAHLAAALERAQGGAWLPQELRARQATLADALRALERHQDRLLEAYLHEAISLDEFERKRRELQDKQATLLSQQHQVDAITRQQMDLRALVSSLADFAERVARGLEQASFAQRRTLVELLIDHVVVTDEEVEIRYVFPTTPAGERLPFCQLRLDYRGGVSAVLCHAP